MRDFFNRGHGGTYVCMYIHTHAAYQTLYMHTHGHTHPYILCTHAFQGQEGIQKSRVEHDTGRRQVSSPHAHSSQTQPSN